MNEEYNYLNDPDEINTLQLIFWLGFNDAKTYDCVWNSLWQQRHIDAYMEGQEKMIRHRLNIPMIRMDEIASKSQ